MDKIDLLKDPWVKCNYGNRNHHGYLNPDFEAGVIYAEQKVVDKVIGLQITCTIHTLIQNN